MGEQVVRRIQPFASPGLDGMAEMQGVPVDDDRGQQVESGDPVVLSFGGAVADFALTADAQGVLERVVCFALVEADLGTALHAGIENPFDNEQGALDPTDLAQGCGQVVLARIGGEFAQDAARRDLPGTHGGGAAEQVGPVGDDQRFARLAGHQRAQFARRGGRIEHIQPLGRQIADAQHETVAQHRADPEQMVGEPAGVGILLLDPPPGLVHRQTVEQIGCLADGRGDRLRCERREAVVDMGIGLDAGVVAVAGVDRVHRLALPRSGVELAVGGRGGTHAPDLRHGQIALCRDHRRQRLVDRLALDMPAREAGELPVIMGIAGLGHLAQAEVQPFGEQDVEQTDPVAARHASAQVGEGIGEAERGIDFEQQVGDADGRQAAIQVEQQFLDAVRRVGGKAVDAQHAVLDAAVWDRAVARGATEPGEAIGKPRLAIGQPDVRVGRDRQLHGARDRHGHEDMSQVAVTMRAVEPDVARAQRIAQVEHHRDLAEARIVTALHPQLTPPLGMRAQEIVGRRQFALGGDGLHRIEQGTGHRRGFEVEAAQHTRRIAAEAVIAPIDMGQRIIAQRVGQRSGHRDELVEPVPARCARDRILQ